MRWKEIEAALGNVTAGQSCKGEDGWYLETTLTYLHYPVSVLSLLWTPATATATAIGCPHHGASA